MGMVCSAVRVSNDKFEAFLKDSKLFEETVFDENNENEEWYIDLDKSWDAIQFILTGEGVSEIKDSPNALERTLFSLQELDAEQDLGYGPAYFLTIPQVQETAKELMALDIEKIRKSIDLNDLARKDIYPHIWDQEESLEYIFDFLVELIEFYRLASENKEVVLTFLN